MLSCLARLALVSVLALAYPLPVLRAQSEKAPNTKRSLPNEIVIKGGMLELNGERVPATVRRVVDAIAPLYRRMTVRMVGTENIVLQDVTLRLPRIHMGPEGEVEPSLHSLFAALQAASGNRFKVQAFGQQDFVLTADAHYIDASRSAEVFKLTPLLGGAPDPSLQRAINLLETELSGLRTRHSEKHPSVRELLEKIESLRKRQADAAPAPDAAAKLIEQIKDVVGTTLESLKPGEPLPEFKFHPGTGLLVVIGSAESIAVTRKVIDALK